MIIIDQREMVPLSPSERALLEYLIARYEHLLAQPTDTPHRYDRVHGEQAGLALAIAYLTGLHFITTPPGGVAKWIPTLKHVLKQRGAER